MNTSLLIILVILMVFVNVFIYFKVLYNKKSDFDPNDIIDTDKINLNGVYKGSLKIDVWYIPVKVNIDIINTISENNIMDVQITGSLNLNCKDTFRLIGNGFILNKTNNCVDDALRDLPVSVKLGDIILIKKTEPMQIKFNALITKYNFEHNVTLTKQDKT